MMRRIYTGKKIPTIREKNNSPNLMASIADAVFRNMRRRIKKGRVRPDVVSMIQSILYKDSSTASNSNEKAQYTVVDIP